MNRVIAALAVLVPLAGSLPAQPADVEVLRAPRGAHQPHAVVGEDGTLHLVFFRANKQTAKRRPFMRRGDLFYVKRAVGNTEWSKPMRCNHDEGSIVWLSTPQIAVGEDGRVHVAWATLEPRGQWYTRTDAKGKRFGKARNLLSKSAKGIENGPAVVVDGDTVFVAWHEGYFKKEIDRVVMVRRSTNGGKTFSRAVKANDRGTGVCACCGLAAHIGPDGALYVAYRGAHKTPGAESSLVQRDMILLKSSDGGKKFEGELVDAWSRQGCPTALAAMASAPSAGTVLVWETEEAVFYAKADDVNNSVQVPPGEGIQKHPSVAMNDQGEVLVTWAEMVQRKNKPGFARRLAWQLFDAEGRPTERKMKGTAELLPMGKATVAARKDGSFVLVY